MPNLKLPANYYQQFDADLSLAVPGEGYGGWKRAEVAISFEHTAVVVMHAWDAGTPEQYPGWYRAVEYIPRANEICRTVFPKLLGAVRASGMKLFHVVGGGDYYKELPGYKRAVELADPGPEKPNRVESDPVMKQLQDFRFKNVFYADHNAEDIRRGFKAVSFPPEARPLDSEYVAENTHQLFAVCRHTGVNHLIYAGFAINWCLLLSPGGMAEISKHGLMCSAFRQATTAVENKESARAELWKENGLWRVSVAFGFVFDVDDFIATLRATRI